MLSLYQPHRDQSDDASGSEGEAIIPAGRPYLTKVNGKLMMAREKRDKPANIAVDLLGEAFGGNTRVIRRRARSLDRQMTPLLIGGVQYVPLQQQQLTYTTPLPQQGFKSSIVPLPQYQAPQCPPTFTVTNPTKQDFDKLKRIDDHFNKTDAGKQRPGSGEMYKSEGMASRTTITITKHICANCGRLRSKKYHHDNPIKPGDNPAPAFCRKCQKNASSTSSSDSDRGLRSTKQKKSKKDNGKEKKKPVEISSESESTAGPEPKTTRKTAFKKKPRRQLQQEGYIVVEEEYSDEDQERGRKGKPYRCSRDKVIVEEYQNHRRPLPPLDRQSISVRSQSIGRLERYDIPKKTSRRRRHREHSPQLPPPPQYQYGEAQVPVRHIERMEETYPRKVPIHFVDDEEVYEASTQSRSSARDYDESPRPSYYETDEQGELRHPSMISPNVVEDNYKVPTTSRRASRENMTYVERRPFRKENSFDDGESVTSTRSHEAAQRRRKERVSPTELTFRPWEQPHVIRPAHNDEVVVVTDRYEYRPKRASKLEEKERRRQEYLDREMLDTGGRTTHFSAKEEAARYYHDDWSKDESTPNKKAPPPTDDSRRRGYRINRGQDPELTESEVRYRYAPAEQYNPPRAPTPPSPPLTANTQKWTEGVPYLMSSDSEIRHQHHKPQKGNGAQRNEPPAQKSRPRRNVSMPRPAYVREATDGRIKKEKMPSSRRSEKQEALTEEYEVEEYEGSVISGLTEIEKAAEAEIRHVTFRDDLSQRSAEGGWTTTESVRAESEGGERGSEAGSGGAW